MSGTNYVRCSNFLTIVSFIIFIHFCTSAPVDGTENAYNQFIAELIRNNCSVPNTVLLPFNTTKGNNFEYLSSYLEICQNTDIINHNKKAVVLCKEIFDNIRNISCLTKPALPDISVNLTKNVCNGISKLKSLVPEDDKSLLKRLTDDLLCEIMCDNEFEKACQVLLWCFEVRSQIDSIENAQETAQHNLPEEDINGNFEQNNAVDENQHLQIDINSKNGKKNAEEAEDLTEAEPNEITEGPGPHGSEGNTGQKLATKAIFRINGKQELISIDQESVDGNQTVLNPANPKITVASKFRNDFKIPTTISPHTSIKQTSNPDPEKNKGTKLNKLPMKETKGNTKVQNGEKQIQSNTFNLTHDVTTVGALSQGSNTADDIDEPSQNVNTKALSKAAVQMGTNATNLSDGDLQDKSNVPDYKIPDEKHQKVDPSSYSFKNNELPIDPGNESSNDEATGLLKNEQNTFHLIQNKLQTTTIDGDKSTKKTYALSTGSQTIKDTTQDETGFAKDKNKVVQSQTNSDSKGGTQDHVKADTIAHGFFTDDRSKDALKGQKDFKVAQPIKDLDNTISKPIDKTISTNMEQPENSQKSKSTVAYPKSQRVTSSGVTGTSTKTVAALEKMEGGSDLRQPADEEADHFEDMENTEDEEYSKPDYDAGLYEVSKNKGSNSNVPSPITAAKETITNQNDQPIEFPFRNSFGQDSNDIQMIAAFPEQEDSHFFFYFLSFVLILMTGYLIFHNKQKIIALIVEGRHERNRRSHRVGYKKLETK